ncbi:MAG: Brp/Blh family beta-carotene 15,15'-dioxygenase [Bacteroidota bacterium]
MNIHLGKLYISVLLLSLFLLGIFWQQSVPEDQLDIYIFATIIVILGLPHGATDHVIFSYNQKKKGFSFSLGKFLGTYGMAMLGFALLWYFLPILSLIVFILISAYHFGQSQFCYLKLAEGSPSKKILYLLWGTWILAIIVLLNIETTYQILGDFLAAPNYLIPLGTPIIWGIIAILTSSILLLMRRFYLAGALTLKQLSFEIVHLIIFPLISLKLGLMLSFALYFGLWHACSSIAHEVRSFQEEVKGYNWKMFYIDAIPFSLMSIIGIGIILATLKYWGPHISPLMGFFILISILTFPHFYFMNAFHHHRTAIDLDFFGSTGKKK